MPVPSIINLNNATPAASSGNQNLDWQADSNNPRNVSVQVPIATDVQLGIVKPDGTIITVAAGAITVPDATSSALGVVKPDGTIITVSAGAITVPKASPSVFGVVEVDNVTITESGGVISTTGGAGFANPMTTEGDIIVGGSSGTPVRLGLPTATNQIRGTGVLTPSGTSTTVTVPFPAAAQAADFAIVFVAANYNASSYPSGWSAIDALSASGFTITKTLSSGDISTGHVSVTLNSGSTVVAAIIVFIGSAGTLRTVASHAPSGGPPYILDAAAVSGDTAIYFGGTIPAGTSTITGSKGTALQNQAGADSSGELLSFSVVTSGTDQQTWNWTGGNGVQYLISVIVEPNTAAPINGQVLTVNTSAPDNLAWENPSTGTGTVTAVTGVSPISSSGGTAPAISVATATASALGVVQPDGTIITVSGGAITVPKGSSSAFGVVEVDGTTITAASGVISAVAGLTNPMTTEGDIIYGGSSGVPTRLAAGTSGNVLQTNGSGSAPTWVSPSGGGGSISAGTFGSLPGSPSSGQLYLFTNSLYDMAIYQSSAWVYLKDGKSLTPPSGFSWMNQSTATVTTANGGENVLSAVGANANNVNFRYVAYPTPSFTRTLACRISLFGVGGHGSVNCNAGIALSDGTKMLIFGFYGIGSSGQVTLIYNSGPSVTNINANVFSAINYWIPGEGLVWLRMDDGVTTSAKRTFFISFDGETFIQIYQESNTQFLTPTRIGYYTLGYDTDAFAQLWAVHWA